MKIFLLLCLLLAPSVLLAQGETPAINLVTNEGCRIDGYKNGEYLVHVWADYLDHKLQANTKHGWLRLYSIRSQDRESKNREKAFADCDKWMAKISSVRDKKAKAAAEADSSHGKHR